MRAIPPRGGERNRVRVMVRVARRIYGPYGRQARRALPKYPCLNFRDAHVGELRVWARASLLCLSRFDRLFSS